jgi:hypothetical protein
MYSLIENAKAKGLGPYWHLRHLFERLPLAKNEDDLCALLPQHIDPATLSIGLKGYFSWRLQSLARLNCRQFDFAILRRKTHETWR